MEDERGSGKRRHPEKEERIKMYLKSAHALYESLVVPKVQRSPVAAVGEETVSRLNFCAEGTEIAVGYK